MLLLGALERASKLRSTVNRNSSILLFLIVKESEVLGLKLLPRNVPSTTLSCRARYLFLCYVVIIPKNCCRGRDLESWTNIMLLIVFLHQIQYFRVFVWTGLFLCSQEREQNCLRNNVLFLISRWVLTRYIII